MPTEKEIAHKFISAIEKLGLPEGTLLKEVALGEHSGLWVRCCSIFPGLRKYLAINGKIILLQALVFRMIKVWMYSLFLKQLGQKTSGMV